MTNKIMIIYPKHNGHDWVFTDEAANLINEPFVFGIDDMIDNLVANIKNANEGFKLIFSSSPFPTYQVELTFIRSEYDGSWYSNGEYEGWLCPALFHYFENAPSKLFIKGSEL